MLIFLNNMKPKLFKLFNIIMKSSNELKMFLYGLFMYLKIDIEAITILATLMCIDTLFGSVKIFRIDYRQFKFKILLLGFLAKITFILIPMVVALTGKGLGYDFKLLVNISIKNLICSETISIISNSIAIRTKKDVEDYDIITQFLKYLRNTFIKISDSLLSSLKNK